MKAAVAIRRVMKEIRDAVVTIAERATIAVKDPPNRPPAICHRADVLVG
jgi:hypothetical protein